MADWRTSWAAAVGQPPSREYLEARRGFSPRDVRRVRRMVRRGEVASDPREARLAVATARELAHQLKRAGRFTMAFFAVIVVAWAALAIGQVASGRLNAGGVIFGLFALWGAYMLVMTPRWRVGVARAERANEELLAASGEPAPPAKRHVAEPEGIALVLAAVVAFVFYSLGFGLLSMLIDGAHVDLGRAFLRGLVFGVLMTFGNLVWRRRRDREASAP